MSEQAFIQISRVSATRAEDEIQVEILLEGRLIRVAMSLQHYARVLTNEAKVPCKVTRNRVLGTKEKSSESPCLDVQKKGE